MNYSPLKIEDSGLFIDPVFRDVRGAFEVFWEFEDFEKVGISFKPISSHHSYNTVKGTLRGMHYQLQPHGQAKLVSCISGAVYDVMVDLRPGSPTYLNWEAVELSAGCGKSIYIPAGCAHGFVTLQDHTTIGYLIEGTYNPDAAGTVRWDDPAIGINWPIQQPILSDRDRKAPDFKP
jgi:dTDP-4-dehydrorhamnose 3,5-epimerase